MHALEEKLGVSGDIIMDAIHCAPDLTQRGLRGIIAEHQFKKLVLEKLPSPWFLAKTPDSAVDFALSDGHGGHYLTIQCKMQTLRAGKPHCDKFGRPMVETQKTRMRGRGKDKTRLYHYGDFDILAVSLWPSTGNWGDFVYARAGDLTHATRKPHSLAAWQTITAGTEWLRDLPKMLDRVQGRHAIRETEVELSLGL